MPSQPTTNVVASAPAQVIQQAPAYAPMTYVMQAQHPGYVRVVPMSAMGSQLQYATVGQNLPTTTNSQTDCCTLLDRKIDDLAEEVKSVSEDLNKMLLVIERHDAVLKKLLENSPTQ